MRAVGALVWSTGLPDPTIVCWKVGRALLAPGRSVRKKEKEECNHVRGKDLKMAQLMLPNKPYQMDVSPPLHAMPCRCVP